jgi:hypothetical protein
MPLGRQANSLVTRKTDEHTRMKGPCDGKEVVFVLDMPHDRIQSA